MTERRMEISGVARSFNKTRDRGCVADARTGGSVDVDAPSTIFLAEPALHDFRERERRTPFAR